MSRNYRSILNVLGGVAPVYDVDAQAYFTANTAITSSLDKDAINAYFVGLKADGIYTKMKAMYLPIWSSAAANKWNLKDPRDLDAAFRIVFFGGWTHATTGATPNGTTGYADTFFTPSLHSATDNAHTSFYSRVEKVDSVAVDMGAFRLSPNEFFHTHIRYSGNVYFGLLLAAGAASYPNATAVGHFIASRETSALSHGFRNGVSIGSNTNAAAAGVAFKVYIGAGNQAGTVVQYSNKEGALWSIGDGLTPAQATAFYNRVQTLMTHFGINV